MPATLADIAKIAHISESAASRALHDNPRISVETRQRVQKIAKELDFEFNSHARSLSTQRCATIGVILPNFGNMVNHTYYLDLLVNDIRFQLASQNFDLLICDSGNTNSENSNLRRLVRQRKVDGLILVVADLPERDRQVIESHNIPMVLANSRTIAMEGTSLNSLSSFFTDNIEGGKIAANHLVERGCRKLLCLADDGATPEMLDRTAGFIAGLKEAGLVPDVLPCSSWFPSTRTFLQEHMGAVRSYDGIFCHMDLMACALLRTMQEAGVSIPGDVKIVGYDDIEIGTYFSPLLTTIHQPREKIAENAVRDLLGRIERPSGMPIRHMSFKPELLIREST
jgi:LacI family transcriptional regulator